MSRVTMRKCCGLLATIAGLCVCLLCNSNVFGGEVAPAPHMPGHWQVTSDFQVPATQVKAMGNKIGADLSGVRNILYDVNGKRVQINVIVTPDFANAERVMTKLRAMKSERALLRKGLTIYEFVGRNDVFSIIVEGRKYLESR